VWTADRPSLRTDGGDLLILFRFNDLDLHQTCHGDTETADQHHLNGQQPPRSIDLYNGFGEII